MHYARRASSRSFEIVIVVPLVASLSCFSSAGVVIWMGRGAHGERCVGFSFARSSLKAINNTPLDCGLDFTPPRMVGRDEHHHSVPQHHQLTPLAELPKIEPRLRKGDTDGPGLMAPDLEQFPHHEKSH